MKKITTIIFFLSVFLSVAQPMYFNTNATGGANSWPFNNFTTARRIQFYIPANNLGAVPPGNNITAIYFQAASTNNQTYPVLNVSLKQGQSNMTGLPGVVNGPLEAGMIPVYAGTNVNLSTTINQWFSITLQTPFLYDPNLPLIVEIEHNATSGAGPTINQAATIPGPGWGRQWANYQSNSITSGGTERVNFGIDVIPATPCNAAPPANTVVPTSFTTCPSYNNPNMTLASTYSLGGLTYQWYSSTNSQFGPWTAITNATSNIAPTPTLNTSTWFQAVVNCTNVSNGATSLTPGYFYVSGPVTGSVPYFESFEGLQVNNRLPNCSWLAANLGTTVTTYTASASNNRVARTGNMFASFAAPANNSIVYSNGISMVPGITYSAALWYTSDYLGSSNWSNLSIMLGTSQSTAGLVNIASVSPAISGPHKLLSGVFTVPAAGDYYIAVRANGAGGGATYLSWDDLSVTIPCYGPGASNSPTVVLNVPTATICAGDQVNFSATGADTYSWNTGATGSSLLENPPVTAPYFVIGTNALTGCSDTVTQMITVHPTPTVLVFANKSEVCSGEQVWLTAVGANAFSWSNSSSGSPISVNPTANNTYSATGTNAFGCQATGAISVTVNPLPTISALSDTPGESCAGDQVILSANGGVDYQWYASTNPLLMQGNNINVYPTTNTTYTVVGTDAKGCKNKGTVNQLVSGCTSLKEISEDDAILVYPNPTQSAFTVEMKDNAMKTITVTDLSGRTLLSQSGTEQKITVSLDKFSQGIYHVRINSDDVNRTIKVIKQ